jgi:hypothetical protein
MSPEERVVLRSTPLTIVIVLLNAGFFSTIFFGAPVAIALHRQHHTLIWTCVGVGWLLGAVQAFRLRACFDSAGIEARNAFRSFSVRWSEVATIRVIPAVWYCGDPGWSAVMLEVETRAGRRFPVRCSTHLSRAKVEQLSSFLDRKAAEFHIDVPRSLIQLWKLNAVT